MKTTSLFGSILFTLLSFNVMSKEITTSINIHASPEKVWSILMEFEKYPDWNPFIKSIKGIAKEGNKISAFIQPPNSNGMTFKPKVLTVNPQKEFRWMGHLLFKGLFDGEHKFEIIDNGDGTTTFIQSEKFKGILIPLFSKMLDKDTPAGFRLMNEKLKQRAEN